MDGLRPDAIFHAPAPNLQALACKGAYSWRARTIHPSITLPSHASMVSGFPPEKHGIFHNDLQPGYIAVPTVMSAAKQAGRKVVLVVGKEKMIQLVPPGSYDVFVWTPDLDDDVIDKAVEEVAAGFDLMFVHLPMVDLTGHAQGWMSEAYLRQVSATDAALARLLAVVPPETTIIVTADHGGSGYIHWSGAPEDVHIPWIVKGPGHPLGPGAGLGHPHLRHRRHHRPRAGRAAGARGSGQGRCWSPGTDPRRRCLARPPGWAGRRRRPAGRPPRPGWPWRRSPAGRGCWAASSEP